MRALGNLTGSSWDRHRKSDPRPVLIVVVIGGIIAGVFTATEGSAIAVVYAWFWASATGTLPWKSFWKILVDSAKMSGMIVFLIGVSISWAG